MGPPGLLCSVSAALLCGACSFAPRDYDRDLSHWEEATSPPPEVAALELAESSTLGDHVDYALWHDPGIRAAAERWHAALQRVPQATSLPDPRLDFAYYIDEVQTRTGPMDWRIGLRQPLPWFGTLDAAGRATLAAARAAQAHFLAARLETSEQVREGWYEYAYVHEAIDVTRAHLELLSSWEGVARTRYATGLGQEADVIRAQVEIGKLDDRVRTLEDLRRPVAARLNAALGRPPEAPLPVPLLEGPEAVALDEQLLLTELPETSPELLALEHAIEAAQDAVDLAEKSFFPDFSVGIDYVAIGKGRGNVSGSGDDAFAVTAGLSLPLWRGKLHAAEAEAKARLSAARADLAERRLRLSADLELALYRWRDAERRVSLYRDTLVPKGEQSVQTTGVAYQAADADFLDLVDAERVLLEFQLAAARAQADRAQALASIERLTGAPLTVEEP